MHASSSIAAALVALVPAVHAMGSAFIQNQCDFDVYVFPTSVGDFQGPITIKANGGKYSQEYQSFSSGGMSMKLSKTKECTQITQFEYTLTSGLLYYDISNVDCHDKTEPCPFASEGLHMTSGSGCPTVTCAAGDELCHDVYNLFNDDWATKACSPDSDTTLYLCATSASGSSNSGSSEKSSGKSSDNSDGFIGAESPSSSLKSSSAAIQAAAVSTPATSAAPSPSTPPPASTPSPTTLATSAKPSKAPKPESSSSVAAPEPTTPPPVNVVYTTEVEYTTQWATKWVSARSEHEDYHHMPRPRSPHAHARRHQHSQQE